MGWRAVRQVASTCRFIAYEESARPWLLFCHEFFFNFSEGIVRARVRIELGNCEGEQIIILSRFVQELLLRDTQVCVRGREEGVRE